VLLCALLGFAAADVEPGAVLASANESLLFSIGGAPEGGDMLGACPDEGATLGGGPEGGTMLGAVLVDEEDGTVDRLMPLAPKAPKGIIFAPPEDAVWLNILPESMDAPPLPPLITPAPGGREPPSAEKGIMVSGW